MDQIYGPETGGPRPDLRGKRVFSLSMYLIETEWEDWQFLILQYLKHNLSDETISDDEFGGRLEAINRVIISLRRAVQPRYPDTRIVLRLTPIMFKRIYDHCMENARPDFLASNHEN